MKRNKMLLIVSIALILTMIIVVVPASPVLAQAIDLDPAFGPPGTTITMTGSGLVDGQSYAIRRSKEPDVNSDSDVDTLGIATATANSSGAFSKTYVMPSVPRGEYFFFVRQGGVTLATNSFIINPVVSVGSSIGKVGDSITIGGRGFRANTNITIYFDNNIVKTDLSGSSGSFNTSFTVPNVAQGTHTISVKDPRGYADDVQLTVNPKLTVSQSTTSPGSQILASGAGFTSSSAISFAIDGKNVNATAAADTSGAFTDAKIDVPSLQGGSHTLTATDVEGFFDTAAITTVQATTISPNSGPVGTSVKISGGGFTANATIMVTFNNTKIDTDPKVITSDSSGNFSANIIVPGYAANPYEIAASDGNTTGKAAFTVTSAVKLDPTTGAIGGSVSVSGSGFAAKAPISIKYDNSGIASPTSDASGAFSTTFKVPPSLAGPHQINVSDGVNQVTLGFTATAFSQISLGSAAGNQVTGNVGSEVTVSGSAFKAGAQVIVTYDGTQIATTTVSAEGLYSVNFKVPAGKHGDHAVTASDGTNKMSLTFTMESTPPPAPTLLAPAKDAQADPLAKFQWTPVTDPSGVSYTLQVAQDPGFNSLFVQKAGLTEPTYQLTAQEQLRAAGKDRPYYWRVEAIDGASNEGPWSLTQTFVVGTGTSGTPGTSGSQLPPWLLYFIYAVVAILLLGIGYYIGRRSGRGFGSNRPEQN